MIEAVASTILQLCAVFLIALVVYLLARRPGRSFPAFIGLIPAPWKPVAIGFAIGLASALALLTLPGVRELASAEGTVAGQATRGGIGAEVLVILMLRAVVQTSLTEEVLFRGLIGRNLIRRFGFAVGNSVQAVAFGAAHLVLLLIPQASTAMVAIIVISTASAGWILGWINERMAGGSILPGWAAHATANLCAYLGLAFVV